MSRRSLAELNAGRAPEQFGHNLRTLREEQGWSMRRLAREARISFQTLLNIERGKGCSPLIEVKLAHALRTEEGRLWTLAPKESQVLHPASSARWFFAADAECRKYLTRYPPSPEEPFRLDPDGIQQEAERLRLGWAHLSKGFHRITSSGLISGRVASIVLEPFSAIETQNPSGTFVYVYCLRGNARITRNGVPFDLVKDDVFIFEMGESCTVGPCEGLRPKELPPHLILVEVDPYRTVPLIRAMNS